MGYVVRIEGHSDSLGDAGANKALSERRANSVKTFLIDKGKLSEKRLTSVGLGESQPIDKNHKKKTVELILLSVNQNDLSIILEIELNR